MLRFDRARNRRGSINGGDNLQKNKMFVLIVGSKGRPDLWKALNPDPKPPHVEAIAVVRSGSVKIGPLGFKDLEFRVSSRKER